MTTPDGRPGRARDPDSLQSRVRSFFEQNQSEVTYAHLVKTFDISKDAARCVVRALRDEGVVETLRVIRPRSAK